jgi:hypothetical protein
MTAIIEVERVGTAGEEGLFASQRVGVGVGVKAGLLPWDSKAAPLRDIGVDGVEVRGRALKVYRGRDPMMPSCPFFPVSSSALGCTAGPSQAVLTPSCTWSAGERSVNGGADSR